MRTILHVDLNNFYASVECLYNPSLRNKPVAVAGDPANRHGIILAKNMPAKKLGVKPAKPSGSPKKKCLTLSVFRRSMINTCGSAGLRVKFITVSPTRLKVLALMKRGLMFPVR